MKRKVFLILWTFLAFVGLCSFVTNAFAEDNCINLGQNPEWNAGIQKMLSLYDEQKYVEAQRLSKELRKICSRSPILTYMDAKVAEGLGDDIMALHYFQDASEYTYQIAVPPETAQKIWYARYEKEHPERTATSVATLRKETDDLLEQTKQLQLKTQNLSNKVIEVQASTEIESMRENAGKSMWAGAGVGIAGIVVAAIGAGLTFANYKDPFEYYGGEDNYFDMDAKNNSDSSSSGLSSCNTGGSCYPQSYAEKKYRLKSEYQAGLALFGVGLTLAVTGAIFAGIYGYQYTHLGKDSDTLNVSFAPNGLAVQMTF